MGQTQWQCQWLTNYPPGWNHPSRDTVEGGAPSGPHHSAFSSERALKWPLTVPDPEICWAVFSLWNLQKDERVLFFSEGLERAPKGYRIGYLQTKEKAKAMVRQGQQAMRDQRMGQSGSHTKKPGGPWDRWSKFSSWWYASSSPSRSLL